MKLTEIHVVVHARCMIRFLIHIQSLFDFSAMNDETSKSRSVNGCLASAKQCSVYNIIFVL